RMGADVARAAGDQHGWSRSRLAQEVTHLLLRRATPRRAARMCGRSGCGSIGPRVAEDEGDGSQEDGEVEAWGPGLDVAVVGGDPVGHGAQVADLAAEAVDLGK